MFEGFEVYRVGFNRGFFLLHNGIPDREVIGNTLIFIL